MALTLTGISKTQAKAPILAGINLTLGEGKLLALLGASGSGKTSLLRIIAGLDAPDTGTITYRDQPLTPGQVALVFQEPVLYPHLTLQENILFSQRFRTTGPLDRNHYLSLVDSLGLGDHLAKKPHQLSGGQAQRAGIARALVRKAPILLLDEPLSSVDGHLAEAIRTDLLALHQELGFTGIYVTHQPDEALRMGQHIGALESGTLAQLGTPSQILDTPASPQVARLIHPLYNQLAGHLNQQNIEAGLPALALSVSPQPGWLALPLTLLALGRHPAGYRLDASLTRTVTLPSPRGPLELGAGNTLTAILPEAHLATLPTLPTPGSTLTLYCQPQALHLF